MFSPLEFLESNNSLNEGSMWSAFYGNLRSWQLPRIGQVVGRSPEAKTNAVVSSVVPDPGNSLATATNIGSVSSTTTLSDFVGDTDTSDFYRFKLPSNSNFNLVLDGLTADADVRLIQDVNRNFTIDAGEVIALSDFGSSSPESINLSGLAGGTYYIQVSQFEGDTNYTLSLSNTNPSNLLFSEIAVGALSGTQTFFDFVGNTDTSDLYSFSLSTTGNFSLALDGLSADADVRVIQDTNNNGLVEDSEVIALSEFEGTASESINLANLAAGNYYVQVYQFEGNTNYTLNLSTTAQINVGSISGINWNDANGNGLQDGGELGLANWTIYLDQNENGQFDTGEISTTTDANGNYTFTGLAPDTYTVAKVLQPGWLQTSPGFVSNGSFETGNFIGWETLGNTSIQTDTYGADPTQGTYQALITNASGSVTDSALEAALGLSAGTLDGLGNGNVTEGSALLLPTITVAAGTTLSFDWNFLTNESTPTNFNDFAFVSIGSVSELADTNSSFVLSPTSFSEETGYETFSYTFTTGGTYTIGLGVVDVGDSSVASGVLVDNFTLTPNGVQVVELNSGEAVTNVNFGNQAIAAIAEPNDTIALAIDANLSLTSPDTFNDTGAIGDNPNIAAGLDVDLFEVQLNQGDQITIDIDTNQTPSSLDSFLVLFDSAGNALAESNDTAAPGETLSLDSYLNFTATTSGTYYIGVSGYGNFSYNPFVQGSGTSGSTGNYGIEISLTPDFSSTYGYGLVDAAAAVASVVGASTPFPTVPDLGGNSWNLDLINAPEVWAQGYTGEGIVVAVIDTGVDYNHTDLDANIWVNEGEIADNNVDDDGNGYVDDIRGWDFVNNDNNPMDLNEHGTHVAGTIAAENNGVGITGVAPDATIMPIRVLNADGSGNSSDTAAGIIYAADNGADIINLSLGGGYNNTVADAVEYAVGLGTVVVMASGNAYSNQPGFPANLAQEWGVAVGAVDINNQIANFSNDAGTTPLDYVVAPGVDVESTIPGNSYASFSGTSMATPHVAGVAALILSANPDLTAAQVESFLVDTANPVGIMV